MLHFKILLMILGLAPSIFFCHSVTKILIFAPKLLVWYHLIWFDIVQTTSNDFKQFSNLIKLFWSARKIHRRNQARRSICHRWKTRKFQEIIFGKLRLPNEFLRFWNRGFDSQRTRLQHDFECRRSGPNSTKHLFHSR